MVRSNFAYRGWLRDLVGLADPFYDQFSAIAWQLPYEYSVANDANRALDGELLRQRFVNETSMKLDGNPGECRVLEFMVALAHRMHETTYDPEYPDAVPDWFMELLINLGLDENKMLSHQPNEQTFVYAIEHALYLVVKRKYAWDGKDGLFPLKRPRNDQRKVEVWYQMMAYLNEKP